MIAGLMVDGSDIRQLPKHALTLKEVEFALGGEAMVKDLRRIGALVPAVRRKQTVLFDAAAVAQVWADLRAGDYDDQLEIKRG